MPEWVKDEIEALKPQLLATAGIDPEAILQAHERDG